MSGVHRLIGIVVLLLAATGCNEQKSADPANRPHNQQIMYGDWGGAGKPEALRDTDQKFIDSFAARGMTRRQGSDEAVERGWASMRSGDGPTTIKRFNQAWLLDPDNYRPYWGFAIVLAERDRDMTASEAMFKKAIGMYDQDELLLIDYALFLFKNERPTEAVSWVEKALEVNPSAHNAHAILATAHMSARDFPKATAHTRIARERKETFGAVANMVCILDKGVESFEDPRADECLADTYN